MRLVCGLALPLRPVKKPTECGKYKAKRKTIVGDGIIGEWNERREKSTSRDIEPRHAETNLTRPSSERSKAAGT
jgi:hypothetical protein